MNGPILLSCKQWFCVAEWAESIIESFPTCPLYAKEPSQGAALVPLSPLSSLICPARSHIVATLFQVNIFMDICELFFQKKTQMLFKLRRSKQLISLFALGVKNPFTEWNTIGSSISSICSNTSIGHRSCSRTFSTLALLSRKNPRW